MFAKSLIPTIAVAGLFASTQALTLTEVLNANNKTLSTLTGLLAPQPSLSAALASASPITILAPSNDAFTKYLATSDGNAVSKDSGRLAALLQYHVLSGSFPSTAFNGSNKFVHTLLNNSTYANVTSGQVVGGLKNGNALQFMSGLKIISHVTVGDVTFNNGIIHVIDAVLTIPLSPSISALDSNLTALAGALSTTSLTTTVNALRDITIFAPSNLAFQAIGSQASSFSSQQLSSILQYHVVNNTVGYSSVLTNTTLASIMGTRLTVDAFNSVHKIFVNSAMVTIADVIVANGVMHVINGVLNPSNTAATPNPTATVQAVAFSGASSASTVPFTSGITGTTTAPSASTSTAGAERAYGTMGAMALLGMGAIAGAGAL